MNKKSETNASKKRIKCTESDINISAGIIIDYLHDARDELGDNIEKYKSKDLLRTFRKVISKWYGENANKDKLQYILSILDNQAKSKGLPDLYASSIQMTATVMNRHDAVDYQHKLATNLLNIFSNDVVSLQKFCKEMKGSARNVFSRLIHEWAEQEVVKKGPNFPIKEWCNAVQPILHNNKTTSFDKQSTKMVLESFNKIQEAYSDIPPELMTVQAVLEKKWAETVENMGGEGVDDGDNNKEKLKPLLALRDSLNLAQQMLQDHEQETNTQSQTILRIQDELNKTKVMFDKKSVSLVEARSENEKISSELKECISKIRIMKSEISQQDNTIKELLVQNDANKNINKEQKLEIDNLIHQKDSVSSHYASKYKNKIEGIIYKQGAKAFKLAVKLGDESLIITVQNLINHISRELNIKSPIKK